MLRTTLCALAVLTFAVTGCGGSSSKAAKTRGPTSQASSGATTSGNTGSSTGGAKKIDACTLLTDDEAAAVLGEAVSKKGPTSGTGESVCEWDSASEYSVTISVGTAGTAAGDTFVPDTTIGTPEPVPALNGKGFYMGSGTVDFAAGERHNYVQVTTNVTGDADKAKAEQLAAQLTTKIAQAS